MSVIQNVQKSAAIKMHSCIRVRGGDRTRTGGGSGDETKTRTVRGSGDRTKTRSSSSSYPPVRKRTRTQGAAGVVLAVHCQNVWIELDGVDALQEREMGECWEGGRDAGMQDCREGRREGGMEGVGE